MKIAVSGKGGVGKTNVVANLSVSLSEMGKKVVVLDADFGAGQISLHGAEIELAGAASFGLRTRGQAIDCDVAAKTLTAVGAKAPLEPVDSRMEYRSSRCPLGGPLRPPDYGGTTFSPRRAQALLDALGRAPVG